MRLAFVAALIACAGCCEFSGPGWHGRRSDHFDGEHFHNQIEARISDWQIVRWRMNRIPGRWPAFVDERPGPPPPQRTDALRITFVGHATVLIQVDGLNILTDPIWGNIAGPTRTIGRTRHRPPGLRFDDLPPIDAVLLSHDHYDHLDIETLHQLVQRFHPRIYAGLGMRALLRQWGIGDVVEMDWFEWAPLGRMRVVAAPARHACRRGACDHNSRLWVSFLLRTPAGGIYFAGDTGYGPHFQELFDRYGPVKVALLPIAPGLPRPLFAPVHLDASDAVIAARVLEAEVAIPIHFGTFAQGDEGDGEAEAKLRAKMDARWVVLHNGQTWTAPPTSSPAAGGS
jgi:L-ascorbate metabolism protein UlaG (beta-lactamase superfamily)